MTSINFGDGEEIVIGGETRLLVHNKENNTIKYQKVLDIKAGDSILSSNGSLVTINSIETVIFEEAQKVYALNLEDEDNFVLAIKDIHGFSMSAFFTIAHNCFVAGTKVQMEDGTEKNIEEIVEGEKVLSYNEETSTNEGKEVVSCRVNSSTKLVKYHFSNQTSITATPEHPFYLDGLKLASLNPESTKQIHGIDREVEEIKVGDLVYVSNGVSKTAIKEIEILDVDSISTYIITVKDNHNFYANNVLVHNK
jgi:intein/homing endonuclease